MMLREREAVVGRIRQLKLIIALFEKNLDASSPSWAIKKGFLIQLMLHSGPLSRN